MEEVAKKGYRFFDFASEDILSITRLLVPSGDEVMKDAVKQAWMDVRFMRLFYLWLSHWDYTWTSDEQIIERLITDQNFHTEDFEMEKEIRLSKLRIGQCGDFLHCPVMRCKPLAYSEAIQFVRLVYQSLDEFLNCGAVVKLMEQIVIFKDAVDFLHRSLKVLPQSLTDNNNCIEYMNFVGHFSLKAACIACLYWAKEANEEAATEMNIVLLDTMNIFIPYAADLAASFICIFRSTDLFPVLNLFEFVAFFFEHFANTIPKDDFLIAQNQMFDHFKLLYAQENIAEELSVYRSIMLSDFMTGTTCSKARLHYYGFLDSWIGLEATKLVYIYFHSVQREFYLIDKLAKWSHNVHIQPHLYEMEMELTFLRTFLLWLAICDDSDEEIRLRLRSIIVSLQMIWGTEREEKGLLAAIPKRDIAVWYPHIFELEGKIQLSKLEIEEWLVNWVHCSLPSKPSTSNKILKFIDSILHSLNALVSCRADKIAPFKKQIETLEDKLIFLHDLLKLSDKCTYTKELGEFNMLVQDFVIDATCLTFHYWVKEEKDIIVSDVNCMFSDMLKKITHITPDVARLYFGAFKAIYLQRSDSLLFGQSASIFVDIVFQDPVTLCNDDFQILRDNVIFLLTFLNDPPNVDAEELIHSQIGNHFWEGVYDFLPIDDDDMNDDLSEKKVLLRCFMTKIETVIANIRIHYCDFPDLPLYNLPKITSPSHLDFLIQNLGNLKERMINDPKFVPFAKYKVIKLEEELVSMSPFFNYIFELQNELSDTWLQVMNLLHLTECLINSCIRSWFVFDHPVWYYMAHLSNVFDKIKVITTKVENMNNVIRCIPYSPNVIRTLSEKAWTSEINEVMVGFKDDAKRIVDDLTRGQKSLDVVSIVGMGGLGKTTLAKKVCSMVKNDFNIVAFYSVSQDYNILLGILECIIKVDDTISRMDNNDLAHKLWKCLSRKKYLIVLDDIWNVIVWNEVKRSFPDNQNGSRVMLTTRFHEVANKCKIQCNPFQLRFLSKFESWELLQKKVFQDDISPSCLHNIGRKISESCKGLPLAIVVIAGVLAGKERSESSWSEIAENVYSYLSEEGCMKILELSYNHLPEYLKPCLLYLGGYPADKLIRVSHVIRLWIAEGFIQKSETTSIEDVAKEYFHSLVERSLLIVSGRSSRGGIKTFRVHDLIHNMCKTKCHEGNFFKLGSEIASSSSSGGINTFCVDELGKKECYEKNFSMYNQYRISVVQETFDSGSLSVGDASTLLFFIERVIHEDSSFMKLKLAQVLYAENTGNITLFRHMLSLVNLRHFHVNPSLSPILSAISNLWNLQSLILTGGPVDLPETIWKLKSLRYVNVSSCNLKFYDHSHEQLAKVISFSTPNLYSAKDLEKLLQRLPSVRKLGITMDPDSSVEGVEVEPLDICRKLESFRIRSSRVFSQINFPSTLKKLSLQWLKLPSTALSAIAELHCLRVLKLLYISFMRPSLETEDLVFERLVVIDLVDNEMIQWNASAESFPCLEQISVHCQKLEELPPCFTEISTLNMIKLTLSPRVMSSAFRIREDQIEFGNQVEIEVRK